MFWIVLAIIASLNADAQESRSRFSADTYSNKASENKIILDGNVTVIKGKDILKADRVELDTTNQNFVATGNVNYDSNADSFEFETKNKDAVTTSKDKQNKQDNNNRLKISGASMEGNLDSPKGFIKDGKIINGKDIFEGRKIERLNKKHFILKEGRYTSCVNDPPDWRLYGNNIDLTSGEYVYMDNVVVEAFGLPITYVPYLVLPVKSDRQSGFLAPNFGFGSDGFNANESYFWAMTRSQDMTYTLGHYNNRGLKEGVEFRSAYAPESDTNIYYFHINDKKFANTLINDEPLKEKNRHGLRMENDFKLSEATYTKMQVMYATDQNVPRDFPDEMPGRAEPALENKLLFTTHTNNFAYNGTASYYENLLSKNPLDRNREQLQRLPELDISIAKTKFSSFMFESDASYLNVYRTGKTFDDTNGNQVFDNNDFIRTGQRFDVYPRLSMPLSNRFFKLTPEIGARYDYYALPQVSSAKRAYAEMNTTLSSEISSVFQRNPDRQYRAIKHVIEPFVTYSVIPNVYQTASPFFDATSNGVNAPRFDSIDNIGRTNTITYGISNRLLAKYIKNFVSSPISKSEVVKPGSAATTCQNCADISKDTPGDIMSGSTQEFLGLRGQAPSEGKKNNTHTELSDEEFSILQPFQWSLSQSYNLIDKTGKPFGYLYSDMLASYEWMTLLLSNFYNIYTRKMGVNSRLRFTGASDGPLAKKYVELSYYNNKTDPTVSIDQLKLLFGFSLWRFGTNVSFILNNNIKGKFSDKLQDKYFDLVYQPPANCWFLRLAVDAPYDRPGINTTITFNLLISGQAVGFGAGQGLFGKTVDNVTRNN
jgi:lipopolysaccharide assembly outer membrane protein LptD (OstA)